MNYLESANSGDEINSEEQVFSKEEKKKIKKRVEKKKEEEALIRYRNQLIS